MSLFVHEKHVDAARIPSAATAAAVYEFDEALVCIMRVPGMRHRCFVLCCSPRFSACQRALFRISDRREHVDVGSRRKIVALAGLHQQRPSESAEIRQIPGWYVVQDGAACSNHPNAEFDVAFRDGPTTMPTIVLQDDQELARIWNSKVVVDSGRSVMSHVSYVQQLKEFKGNIRVARIDAFSDKEKAEYNRGAFAAKRFAPGDEIDVYGPACVVTTTSTTSTKTQQNCCIDMYTAHVTMRGNHLYLPDGSEAVRDNFDEIDVCINANPMNVPAACINDAMGSGRPPNVEFINYIYKDLDDMTCARVVVVVRAIRHIARGEQLLLSYGDAYWESVRRNKVLHDRVKNDCLKRAFRFMKKYNS